MRNYFCFDQWCRCIEVGIVYTSTSLLLDSEIFSCNGDVITTRINLLTGILSMWSHYELIAQPELVSMQLKFILVRHFRQVSIAA